MFVVLLRTCYGVAVLDVLRLRRSLLKNLGRIDFFSFLNQNITQPKNKAIYLTSNLSIEAFLCTLV